MRILYVAPNISVPGTHGGSTHVTEVFEHLSRMHETVLIAKRGSSGERVVGTGFETAPRPVRHVPPLLALPSTLRAARAFRPDVVYERGSAFGLGAFISRILQVPLITMVLDRSVSPISLHVAKALVATTPAVVPMRWHAKFHRVSWGANTDRFRPDIDGGLLRSTLGFGDDDVVVGYVGGFYPWHGLETLIEAAALLSHKPDAQRIRFLLVGSGPRFSKIKAMMNSKGLNDRVIMTDRVPYPEVPQYVAACDVCVAAFNPQAHPVMRKKGFYFDPLKLFEYLAAGKPSITLDSENIRRLVTHREHALLIPPGDARVLCNRIMELVNDKPLRTRIARAGHQICLEKYSWQAHVRHLTSIFRGLAVAA